MYRCPGPCESFTDPVASAFRGSQVIAFSTQGLKRDGKAPWNPPPSPPCYRCSKPTTEICPTCHLDLPAGWRAGNAVCVALAGARATGKSIYLAVLIKQLEQMLHQMNSLLSFATTASYTIYTSSYEAQLYREREIMQATAPANMAERLPGDSADHQPRSGQRRAGSTWSSATSPGRTSSGRVPTRPI